MDASWPAGSWGCHSGEAGSGGPPVMPEPDRSHPAVRPGCRETSQPRLRCSDHAHLDGSPASGSPGACLSAALVTRIWTFPVTRIGTTGGQRIGDRPGHTAVRFLTLRQPFEASVPWWSMRSWESVRHRKGRRRAVPRSHEPSEERVDERKVDFRLMSRSPACLPDRPSVVRLGHRDAAVGRGSRPAVRVTGT